MWDRLKVRNPIYPLVAVTTALLVLLLGLVLSSKPEVFTAYLVALCLLYSAFGYGGVVAKCLLIFIPLGIITGGVSILIKSDWNTAMATLGRVVLLGLSVVALITTPPVNLTRCMTRLHLPRFLTLGMLVTIRFVPILAGEIRRIREAMRTRGVNMAWYNVGGFYRAFLIPFVIQLINISDLLAVSVETRAFSLTATETTVYKCVPFTLRDALFTIGMLLFSGAGILGMVLL
ncbi:MAG TPA: hypothetical protein DEB24_04645 [Coriobacteriia bacterium]|nr:hypothetical protein [Coriobacteriia bacterium]